MSVELLVTLEAAKIKGNPLTSIERDDNLVYDCGRASAFSKFLSEEWDLDFLAIFLLNRGILQKQFNFKFKDVFNFGLCPTTDLFAHSNKLRGLAMTQFKDREDVVPAVKRRLMSQSLDGALSQLESEGKNPVAPSSRRNRNGSVTGVPECIHGFEKVVPIAVSAYLHFLPDAALPEAPALCFHRDMLDACSEIILPDCPAALRAHVSEKVLFCVRKLLRDVTPIQRRASVTGGSAAESEPAAFTYIPASVFLNVLCEQWKSVPEEIRQKFAGAAKAGKSLERLNDVYDNNNRASKERLEEIRQTEMKLSQSASRLLKLRKQERKWERKWKDNKRLSSQEDMDTLTNLRVQITEEEARRYIYLTLSLLDSDVFSLQIVAGISHPGDAAAPPQGREARRRPLELRSCRRGHSR
jgi:hypothetical protein